MTSRDSKGALTIGVLQSRLIDAAQARYPGAVVRAVVPLEGGASSLTFRAEFVIEGTVSGIVVKVAPPGREPVRNRDVLRQARIMTTLASDGRLPVPTVIFSDLGDPPAIPPLFAMNFIPGDSAEPLFDELPTSQLDAAHGPSAEDVSRRAHHAAALLAALQQTDLDAPAFVDEAVWTPADEVKRWSAALATVDAGCVDGWPRCRDALLANQPGAAPPVLCHGDYRLGNMLAVAGGVEAIIDWELWGIGDPRFDLAWLRMNADPGIYRRATRLGASMPSPDALLESYSRSFGATVVDLDWFDALARFKTVATWALILKHAGTAGRQRFESVRSILPGLLVDVVCRLG